jgi:hypothetical protein
MPKIVAYHAEIPVQSPDGLVLIRADLEDWYDDGKTLSLLGQGLGVGTVGEVVEAVKKRGMGNTSSPVVAVRIEKVHGDSAQAAVARSWDDPI